MNRKPTTRPGMDPMIHNDQRSLQFHSPSPAALLDNALLKRQSLLGDLKWINGLNGSEPSFSYLDFAPTTVSAGSSLDHVAPDFSCAAGHAGTSSASLGGLLRLL